MAEKTPEELAAEAVAQDKLNESREEGAEATQRQADAIDALNQAGRVNRQQLEDINTALQGQLASFENSSEANDAYRAAVQSVTSAQREMVQAVAEGNVPLQDSLKLVIENAQADLKKAASSTEVSASLKQVGELLLENNETLTKHEQRLKTPMKCLEGSMIQTSMHQP